MLIWLTLFDSVRLILQSMLSSKFEPLPAASMIMNGCLRQNVINAGNSKAAFRQLRFCCDQRLGEWGAINQKKLQLIATQTRQSLKSDRGLIKQYISSISAVFHEMGNGCVTIARAVASDTREPEFESSHHQFYRHLFAVG